MTMHSSGKGKRNVSADLPGGSANQTLHFKTFSGDVKVTK